MKLELRSVRLKNCGPIDDIKIDFFDVAGKTLPVCVIGGANGSGKTTFLQMIIVLAEMLDTQKFRPFQHFKQGMYVQADWLMEGFELSTFLGELPEDARLKSEYWGFKLNSSHEFDFLKTSIYFDHSSLPSLIYFPHNRSLEPVSGEQIRKEENGHKFVHRIEAVRKFPGSLTSYLIWLDYAEPDRFAETQQFLNSLDFEGKTFHINRKALDVLVKTANGQYHSLHELSSGEQNLLIILIELRRKLRPGSVVLIDEIENSLHPAYQHRLAQGLLALQREIPYQLIVTTHAPAFVEIFGEENTRILTPF